VGAGSTIGAGAVFGDGAVLGERSVFGPGVTVGRNSYVAGRQVFAGGDHFGAGCSFGPNIRFGPNTMFDGDELFAAGSSFGDSTKFDWAGAGKDTFGGGHFFGVDTHWGGNEPQESGGGPIRPQSAGHAGVDHAVVVGLPPGYMPTSIPGVYQYSAEPSMAPDEQQSPHAPDPDWKPSSFPRGQIGLSGVSNPKELPHAAPPAAGFSGPSAQKQQLVARKHLPRQRWEQRTAAELALDSVASRAATAGAEAGVAAAKLRLSRASRGRSQRFGGVMARWLQAHTNNARDAGPSGALAAEAAAARRLSAKETGRKRGKREGAVVAGDKLDGMADHKVPVARVEDEAKPNDISFFSMFK
jgi:hypothetical protein